MLLDGSLVSLCTFPGVLVHQLLYLLACRYFNVEAAFSVSNFTQHLSAQLVTIGEDAAKKLGRRLEQVAVAGSAIACCLLGMINQLTPNGSVAEGVVVWIAISVGVQSFPFKASPAGRIMSFLWMDAVYGLMLYMIGKIAYAGLAT